MIMDPVAFWIGSWPIRWYGLSYSIGIILAWGYCRWLVVRFKGLKKEDLDGFITWGVIAILIGGRMGNVLFYYPEIYFNDPIRIFKVWEGGMAFHGGVLGVGIAFMLYCYCRKISVLSFADCWSCGVPIGLFFGRLANFVNQELYGRITKVWWGVVFPDVDHYSRHPSQLYEAFSEGILLFFILNVLALGGGASKKKGLITGVFLASYACMRWMNEYFREPIESSEWFSWVTLGQLYSVPLLAIGMLFIWNSYRKKTYGPNHVTS